MRAPKPLYTITSDVIVTLVHLEAYEVTLGVHASYCCCTAAHAVVQYKFAWVCISFDKVLKECHWFLCGVNLWLVSRKFEYILWIIGVLL